MGWDRGGLTPWSATVLFETFKTSYRTGKHLVNHDLENKLNWPMIDSLFGSMIQHHPISAKVQSRLHQFGKKISARNPPDVCCVRGECGRETSWSQTLRMWKFWTRQISMLEDCTRRRSYFRTQVEHSKLSGREQALPRSTSIQRRRVRLFKESRTALSHETKERMTLEPGFLVDRRELIVITSNLK